MRILLGFDRDAVSFDRDADARIETAASSKGREARRRVWDRLTPREDRVVRLRSGVGKNPDHTVREVGQQLSLTCDRVRQIEAKALRKLKHPSMGRKRRRSLDK
jgi:RNA polymerase primary sigma factor